MSVSRRKFLQYIGASLGAAVVAPSVIEQIANKFTEAEAEVLMAQPAEVSLRTFQSMLNDYFPTELLKEELLKRDYLLSMIKKEG